MYIIKTKLFKKIEDSFGNFGISIALLMLAEYKIWTSFKTSFKETNNKAPKNILEYQ